MFLNKDSIIINGVSMGQYIVQAQYEYNKIWGSDSGRNLNGDMIASLVGVFPKIILQFRGLNKNELEVIVPILDAPRQLLTYYDPNKKQNITIETYTGDYGVVNKNIINSNTECEGFDCSFISTKKRV